MAIKVKSIWLNRAEGPSKECFARTVKSFGEAATMLRDWSRSTQGGYDKVDFKVTWVDGETYSGRYDMKQDDSGDLIGHIVDTLLFYAGLQCPLHMTEEAYEALIEKYEASPKLPRKSDYKKFLDTYLS